MHWLEGVDPARPWFLWVHLLDPHLPYELRGPGGAVAVGQRPGWIAPLAGQYEHGGFRELLLVREGVALTRPDERAAVRQLYQTEVDYAAWWARELVRAAQRASAGRELIWVVTSDHGEEFFEEGGYEHGHSLGDPVLRVPLLASGLGEDPRAVRLIDLGPWILSHLQLTESSGFRPAEGSQLLASDSALVPFALPVVPGPVTCAPPAMLAEGLLYGPPRTRFVLPDGIRIERMDETGSLTEVPACAADAPGDPSPAPPWQALDFWRERRTLSPVSLDVDDDLRRQLRALGYVR
jgi:hypothetical protein